MFTDCMSIDSCPEVTCGRWTDPDAWIVHHLSTEYYVKRAHPLRVDVVAIRKISFLDHRLEYRGYRKGWNWSSWNTSRSVGWNRPNYPSTAAVRASSLDGVRTVHGRPVFACGFSVTLCASRRRCSNHRNTLAFGGRRGVADGVLLVPSVKRRLQGSSCVYSIINRSQPTRPVHCI
jgi:hypothetical protein